MLAVEVIAISSHDSALPPGTIERYKSINLELNSSLTEL